MCHVDFLGIILGLMIIGDVPTNKVLMGVEVHLRGIVAVQVPSAYVLWALTRPLPHSGVPDSFVGLGEL